MSEIKASRLARFTVNEWREYAGAVKFDDNSLPFYGVNHMIEIVADRGGIGVFPLYDEDTRIAGGWQLSIKADFNIVEKIVEVLAERILKDTDLMFPVEINRYLLEKGFISMNH